MTEAPPPSPTPDWQIHLVDDDAAFSKSLLFLLDSMGWQAVGHACADDYLRDGLPVSDQTGCLLLDIRMPGMSGLELQQHLNARRFHVPIVFLTGHGDVELAVQAMKRGAFDFLEKPFKDQRLLDIVSAALRQRQAQAALHARSQLACERLARLTPRETEVAHLIARGLPNKLVGRELGISEKTVHIHRQHIMEKAEISSAAELARLILQSNPLALD